LLAPTKQERVGQDQEGTRPLLDEGRECRINVAFAAAQVAGLVVTAQPLFVSRHQQLAAVVARYAIPTVYAPADLAKSGGLMSYGTSVFDIFRRAGNYAGKILAGAKPAELPVKLPTKFELKINLNTARALGLTIPSTLLARADEVIE